jgi:hypothetical protein
MASVKFLDLRRVAWGGGRERYGLARGWGRGDKQFRAVGFPNSDIAMDKHALKIGMMPEKNNVVSLTVLSRCRNVHFIRRS